MTNEVISFTKKRNEAIEQRRKEFERVMFDNFLSLCFVLNDESVTPIELIDIYKDGLLFQIPSESKHLETLKNKKLLDLRIYFTEKTFLPIKVEIEYCEEYLDDDDGFSFSKFSCRFDKNVKNFEAMDSFIDFIYKFSEYASLDRKNPKLMHI